MNYPESLKILEEIKKSKSVLLMCHKSPDLDSMISCLLMSTVLSKLNINSKIYSIDEIPNHFKGIDKDKKIEDKKNLATINFSEFDLFMALDVNELIRFGFEPGFNMPLPVINIDHHSVAVNSIKSSVAILKESLSATSEAIYFLAKDFGIQLNRDELQLVLVAIMNDTSMFVYGSSPNVFRTVTMLMEDGANYEKAHVFLNQSNNLNQIHYWSEMMAGINIDTENRFAYTSMSYKNFVKYGKILQPTRTVADMFIRTLDNTDFGIVMVENKKGELNVSIRARESNFSIIDLLVSLGGGGHVSGGGASIKRMNYKDSVKFVLEKAREFSKNKS